MSETPSRSRGLARKVVLVIGALSAIVAVTLQFTGPIDRLVFGIRLRSGDVSELWLVATAAILYFCLRPKPARDADTVRAHASKIHAIAPIAIVVLAALVRVWGLGFGLPHSDTRPDEGAVASIALGLSWNHLHPLSFNYPPLFMLVVSIAVWLVFTRGVGILGHLAIRPNIGISTTTMYMTARVLSAAAGVGTVWLLFVVATRLFGRRAALAASAFLALAFLHVRDSHFGVTDVPMTFMVIVAFLAVVKLAESGSTKDLIAAAIATGLGTATKYNAVLMTVPAVLAILTDPTGRPFKLRLTRVALFPVVLVAVFLAASPYSLLDWPAFLRDVSFESHHLANGHGVDLGRGWVYHVTTSLRYGLGLPLFFAGVLGLILLCWRNLRIGAICALFPMTYYVVIGSGHTVFARYILPVVPFLCLTAGYGVTAAASWLAARANRPRWGAALTLFGVVGVVWPSAVSVLTFDCLIARPDSRLVARRWVETRYPPRTTIAQIGPMGGHVFLGDPDEVPYAAANFTQDAPEPRLVIIQSSPLNGLADLGNLKGVLERDYTLRLDEEVAKTNALDVYDRQDEFYLPINGFTDIERPGPNLQIYERRSGD